MTPLKPHIVSFYLFVGVVVGDHLFFKVLTCSPERSPLNLFFDPSLFSSNFRHIQPFFLDLLLVPYRRVFLLGVHAVELPTPVPCPFLHLIIVLPKKIGFPPPPSSFWSVSPFSFSPGKLSVPFLGTSVTRVVPPAVQCCPFASLPPPLFTAAH